MSTSHPWEIGPDELQTLRADGESPLVIDCREPEEDLGMVLSTRQGIKVPYKREIRGESVAFAAQRELGYYTLSESGGKVGAVPLYRYNRVPER